MTHMGWLVLAAALVGLLMIVWVPRYIIPNSRSSRYDEILRVATTRNSIRGTIAQIVAGLAFVATFIQGSVNFNSDFRQKSDLATADQFAKAFSQLRESVDNTWVTIGSFNVLARIADGDARYREPVYSAMAQYIVGRSRLSCGLDAVEKGAQVANTFRDAGYAPDQTLRPTTRLFLDRGDDDKSRRMFDLAGACLANADAFATRGLSWLYMPGAKLLRISAGNTIISDTDMRGIEAGVVHNSNWPQYEGTGAWTLHHEVSPDKLARLQANFQNARFTNVRLDGAGMEGANLVGASFTGSRLLGTNFELADLTAVSFGDSDVNGAGFYGANIARADFSKVKNITKAQILSACIRDDAWSRSIAPSLPADVAAEVQKAGGIQACK